MMHSNSHTQLEQEVLERMSADRAILDHLRAEIRRQPAVRRPRARRCPRLI